jgi:hypothetical protein
MERLRLARAWSGTHRCSGTILKRAAVAGSWGSARMTSLPLSQHLHVPSRSVKGDRKLGGGTGMICMPHICKAGASRQGRTRTDTVHMRVVYRQAAGMRVHPRTGGHSPPPSPPPDFELVVLEAGDHLMMRGRRRYGGWGAEGMGECTE